MIAVAHDLKTNRMERVGDLVIFMGPSMASSAFLRFREAVEEAPFGPFSPFRLDGAPGVGAFACFRASFLPDASLPPCYVSPFGFDPLHACGSFSLFYSEEEKPLLIDFFRPDEKLWEGLGTGQSMHSHFRFLKKGWRRPESDIIIQGIGGSDVQ